MKQAIKNLREIPGVGPNIAGYLVDLGYRQVKDIQGNDPEKMYEKLMDLRGEHIDRCVLYVFRCAVYYANNSVHEPDLLKWWNWKDK
jgi:hypothetical protein